MSICLDNAEGKSRVYTAVPTITTHCHRLRFKGNKSLIDEFGRMEIHLEMTQG